MDKRIVIIGNSGAGKSTLANKLGEKLGIPVYNLDIVFLDSEGKRLPLEERSEMQREILAKPQWCIDGSYPCCVKDRVISATHIIILKIPTLLCIFNVLKRYCRGLFNHKAVGVHQKFRKTIEYNFLFRYIPNFYKHSLPKVTKIIEEQGCEDKVQIAHSYKEIDKIFADLTT